MYSIDIICINSNPKEQFRSLGYIYAYVVTKMRAGVHHKTFGYKI